MAQPVIRVSGAFSNSLNSLRLFAALFLDEVTQLALHRLEGIMHDLRQWFMRPVIDLLLLGHEFVTRRHRDVDSNAKRISLFVGMIRLLNRDVATADVIAEFVEASRLLTHHLLDSVRFHQAAVADIHRQLHTY
jgi:hypothetical protein